MVECVLARVWQRRGTDLRIDFRFYISIQSFGNLNPLRSFENLFLRLTKTTKAASIRNNSVSLVIHFEILMNK